MKVDIDSGELFDESKTGSGELSEVKVINSYGDISRQWFRIDSDESEVDLCDSLDDKVILR